MLLSFGFSEREARLYLVLLRSGSLGAREAAEAAGLHRATAYRALLRLLMRGVIVGDGRTPQRFQAVGIDLLIARVGAFLREEEELNDLAAQAAKAALLPLEGRGETLRLPHAPQLLARPASGPHAALVHLAAARRTVDVMVRPLAAPPPYRAALVQTISKLVRSGVFVRLVLDATVADRRIKDRLAREGITGSPALQVRHFTPLGSHSYIVDGARSIRFPILGILTRTADVGDPDRRPRAGLGRGRSVRGRLVPSHQRAGPSPVDAQFRLADPGRTEPHADPPRVLLHTLVPWERGRPGDGAGRVPVLHAVRLIRAGNPAPDRRFSPAGSWGPRRSKRTAP